MYKVLFALEPYSPDFLDCFHDVQTISDFTNKTSTEWVLILICEAYINLFLL